MKFLGKSLIFISLLAGIAIQGAELESKEKSAQKALDNELLEKTKCNDIKAVELLLGRKANPNCDFSTPFSAPYQAVRPLASAILNMGFYIAQQGDYLKKAEAAAISKNGLDSIVVEQRIKDHDEYKEKVITSVKIAKLLLCAKADPNIVVCHHKPSNCPFAPLDLCLELIISPGSPETNGCNVDSVYTMTHLLLEHGADSTANLPCGLKVYDCIDPKKLQKCPYINHQVSPKLKEILDEHAEKVRENLDEGCLQKLPSPLINIVSGYLL